MSEWISICTIGDIPVLGARRVARAKGLDVAVFRNADDEVFALLDRCPHKGGPLSQGIVFGRSVACRCTTGRLRSAAARRRRPMRAARLISACAWRTARCSCAPTSWPAVPWSRPARMPVPHIAQPGPAVPRPSGSVNMK